jgi:hypothetical protein
MAMSLAVKGKKSGIRDQPSKKAGVSLITVQAMGAAKTYARFRLHR